MQDFLTALYHALVQLLLVCDFLNSQLALLVDKGLDAPSSRQQIAKVSIYWQVIFGEKLAKTLLYALMS